MLLSPRRFQWSLSLVSLVMLLIYLFPIYWMLTTAVKPGTQLLAYPPQFIPTEIDFTVWQRRILDDPDIPRYFLNSAIVGSGTAALTIALAAPAAYGLAHLPIRGKSLVMLVGLVSLMFPAIMLATPLFVIFSRLGLTGSYPGLIIANTTLALPFALIILRPFFLNVPTQLTEAARIDGCSSWGAFFRVILPIARPGIFTVAVFSFLFGWSDLVFALTLTDSADMRPVTAGLWNFMGANVTEWNSVMAFSSLAMLPPLLLFLLSQRYIVAGLSAGAVKE